MKMTSFAYHRPESIPAALALLAEHGSDAKVLAGGQSLLPVMAMRLASPAHVIDIGRMRDVLRIEESPTATVIGPLVRHADLEDRPSLVGRAPLVAQAIPFIGHRAIRNRGTVLGSLAHADPSAELPAVALALRMEFVLRRGEDTRVVPAADFFRGFLTTAVADDELLVEVRIPLPGPNSGSSIHEMSRRHGDYAVVGSAVHVQLDDGRRISSAAIALFGVGATPLRVPTAESQLIGQLPSAALFASAGAAAAAAIDPPSDDHATTAYRKHLASALTSRALHDAANAAGDRR